MIHTAPKLIQQVLFLVADPVATGYSSAFIFITPELVGAKLKDLRLCCYSYDSGSSAGTVTCVVYVKKLTGVFVYPIGTVSITYANLCNTSAFTPGSNYSFILGDIIRFQITQATVQPRGLVVSVLLG